MCGPVVSSACTARVMQPQNWVHEYTTFLEPWVPSGTRVAVQLQSGQTNPPEGTHGDDFTDVASEKQIA